MGKRIRQFILKWPLYYDTPILLIRTKDGRVHKKRARHHFEMADDLGINPDLIVDTGWKVGRKITWRGDTSPEVGCFLKTPSKRTR